MTPLKDTLEVTNPATEKSVATVGERSQSDSGGLRADAVSLEVPVKVHGSRVTEVVRGVTPHTEPFEEQTSTMIVFPQGGVLRMATAVTAGQMVVLTNLKSGHDAICRVVKVRAYAQSQCYVEVEFTNRQQGYWGVRFAGDTNEPARTILPPPPAPVISTVVEIESAKRPAPPVFAAPAKPSVAPVQHAPHPQKKESSFVGIGSQEDVQPAAAATTLNTKVERSTVPAASLSMTELRGDGTVAPPITTSMGAGVPGEVTDLSEDLAETSHESAPDRVSFAAGNALAAGDSPAAPQKIFGARFDSLAPSLSEIATDAPATAGTNWFLIAAGIAALLVAAVGGAFYFHVLPGSKASARTESTSSAVSSPATSPTASSTSNASPATTAAAVNSAPASTPMAQVAQPTPAAPAAAPSSGVVARTSEPASAPANANRAVVAERMQAPAPARSVKARPDMSAALTAHPVSSQRAAANDAEAPSVDTGASATGQLEGITSAADLAPPPTSAPAIKVGGDVQPPKLVSSVMPIYPPVAKSAGVAGNVVVVASISPAGLVVGTKILSGPPMLRQAALDALKRWKYQPATLNGSPVAVDVTVTMSFHN